MKKILFILTLVLASSSASANFFDDVEDAFTDAGEAVVGVAKDVGTAVVGVGKDVAHTVVDVVHTVGDTFTDIGGSIVDFGKKALGEVVSVGVSLIGGITGGGTKIVGGGKKTHAHPPATTKLGFHIYQFLCTGSNEVKAFKQKNDDAAVEVVKKQCGGIENVKSLKRTGDKK